jgi:hypothetical protein
MVELDQIGKDRKLEVLHDLIGYPFWYKNDKQQPRRLGYPVPQPTDRDYHDKVVALAQELADKLVEIRPELGMASAPTEPPLATVYIAPVFDSLERKRAQLISELRQFWIEAIPVVNRINFDRQSVEQEMENCSHFIQLLDTNYNMGVPAEQKKIAGACKLPILQWRAHDLDYRQANEEQKALLEGPQVIACTLPNSSSMCGMRCCPNLSHLCPKTLTPACNIRFSSTPARWTCLLPNPSPRVCAKRVMASRCRATRGLPKASAPASNAGCSSATPS